MIERKNNILIGVTASIAIYKSLEVISILKKKGLKIRVALTKEAKSFISPVVFEALTNNPVYTNVLEELSELNDTNITHVALARWADVFAVVPATSNIIAKLAYGLSDDAVSLTGLATKAKKLIAPAMNSTMYLHPTTQENLKRLKGFGYEIVEPIKGELACNTKGIGHIANVEDIATTIEKLAYNKPLKDRYIIVTAAGTREPIDPVRFIGNRSSGKMGYWIAHAAHMLGAKVKLISGPTHLKPPYGVEKIDVESALDMLEQLKMTLDETKEAILIMAAAVSDFRVKNSTGNKIKRENHQSGISIELEPNPDLTREINSYAKSKAINLKIVGFAAETDNLIENASRKIKKKGLEFIVANDVSRSDIGFDSDYNEATILHREGKIEKLPKMSKEKLAYEILRRLI